jgi:hypothetical protein
MKRSAIATIPAILFAAFCAAQTIPSDSLYYGQIPPGSVPQKFAPGTVSIPGRNEANITFYINNHWTIPDTIPFSVGRACAEPIFACNGNRLYMNANNVVNQQGVKDLCYSEKQGNNWGNPVSIGNPPNSEPYQYHPSLIADSTVYFSSNAGYVCKSRYQNGTCQNRVILPRPVNYKTMIPGPTLKTWET